MKNVRFRACRDREGIKRERVELRMYELKKNTRKKKAIRERGREKEKEEEKSDERERGREREQEKGERGQ